LSTEAGRARLQKFLADEVDRRGKTWVGLGAELEGDSSASTIRSYVQSGVARRPHRRTLAVIDRMLGWEPGSARRVLDGGDPVSAGAEHAATSTEPPALSGAKWERLSADQQSAVINVIDSMLDADGEVG
jgi:hypothetical protein